MKRLNVEHLVLHCSTLFWLLSVSADSSCLALPSDGFTSLAPQARAYSQSEHNRMYAKQNPVSNYDNLMEKYATDPQAPTRAATYGTSDQSGASASPTSNLVSTTLPPSQAQMVLPQSFQKTLTQWSYRNIGNGVNMAVPTPAVGQPWYSFPPARQISAQPQGAAALAALKYFPQLPLGEQSAMPTNTIMQANYTAAALAAADLINAPKRQVDTAKANLGAQQQEVADSTAKTAEDGFATNLKISAAPLINVANEGAGVPTAAEAPLKTDSQAIWMVMQMYKSVYVPMALLLLLPGAILTNIKGMLAGFMGNSKDEDAVSPFSSILRSVISIFLIPATQLFASWSIDVGNSMTYEVQHYITPAVMTRWQQEQTFDAPVENSKNALSMPKNLGGASSRLDEGSDGSGGALESIAGKMDGGSEHNSQVEQQGPSTRLMQMAFNMLNAGMNLGMLMLSAFQIVFICYLFLMGPIAAAFFAWPTGCGSLFKAVFANWVDALINVSLWKFWWCVVILVMQTRIEWLQQSGSYLPNSMWELIVYTAFMVILLYVPFVPFDYKPGQMVAHVLSVSQEITQAASSGAGKSGSGSSTGGGPSATAGGGGSGKMGGTFA